MADAAVEQLLLAQLREDPEWPKDLDRLAQQAAAIGRLTEARNQAADRSKDEADSRSFYALLRKELRVVLGRPS